MLLQLQFFIFLWMFCHCFGLVQFLFEHSSRCSDSSESVPLSACPPVPAVITLCVRLVPNKGGISMITRATCSTTLFSLPINLSSEIAAIVEGIKTVTTYKAAPFTKQSKQKRNESADLASFFIQLNRLSRCRLSKNIFVNRAFIMNLVQYLIRTMKEQKTI